MHSLLPPILLEHKQGYLRAKNELIYKWTGVLSKKPLGQRAVAVRRGVNRFDPMRKAKPQSHLGTPLFWSLSKTFSPPCPKTTSSSLYKNAAVQVKTRGNAFLSSLLKQRVCKWHIPTVLIHMAHIQYIIQRYNENGRNWGITTEWTETTEHEPHGVFTTMGLRMASQPKEIGLNCKALTVSSYWCDHFSQVTLDKLI